MDEPEAGRPADLGQESYRAKARAAARKASASRRTADRLMAETTARLEKADAALRRQERRMA